jgi:hypothetical protein
VQLIVRRLAPRLSGALQLPLARSPSLSLSLALALARALSLSLSLSLSSVIRNAAAIAEKTRCPTNSLRKMLGCKLGKTHFGTPTPDLVLGGGVTERDSSIEPGHSQYWVNFWSIIANI